MSILNRLLDQVTKNTEKPKANGIDHQKKLTTADEALESVNRFESSLKELDRLLKEKKEEIENGRMASSRN